MDLLPLVFSSGWASGVNAYLAVLVLGLSERFGSFADLPDALGRTEVLLAAAVMASIEFFADKIPYVDSTWDAISTIVRPAIGTTIALLVSGDATSLEQAGYAALGGGTALASHSVKAGGRLALNTSPEPFTNIAASLVEDIAVVGIVLVAIRHPWLAGAVCLVLLVVGLVLLRLALRLVRRGWRRWKNRTAPA
ncbi:hypothetical protein ABIE44_000348 [Marmoricola sp. OAE513]|uniref:DUF4126 domain-containing protein n=1 Tax=Marmoricola sp. OAE513 TaxID=2817894 RepID=UPI001AEAA0F4